MPIVAINNAIYLESVPDISSNRNVVMNLLSENVKVHFIDYDHTCNNPVKFNFLRGSHPSIRIITINPSLRHAVAMLVTDFNEDIQGDDDYDDDNNSDHSIDATEPGDGTCPQCGF